jgi:hypothetical protein
VKELTESSSEMSILHTVEEEKIQKKWKHRMASFLDSWPVAIFMTLITIYALFFDDIRIIFLPKIVDDYFNGLTIICLIFFTVEIIMSSISKKTYCNSFFFWLDIFSTVSLLTDIGWLMEGFIATSETSNVSAIFKTSRAGRITRVI